MAHSENEKFLGGEVSIDLYERFISYIQAHNGLKIKQVITVMSELWLSLPPDFQALLLHSTPQSNNFFTIVKKIVDDRIEERLPSATSVVEEALGASKRSKARKQKKNP